MFSSSRGFAAQERGAVSKPRIAIVGGGLGGMTVAILLQQAGYDAQIYEQAGKLGRLGAGITLGPNVMKILRRAGLVEKMYSIGIAPQTSLSRAGDTGEILYKWPTNEWTARFSMPFFIMHRGDLQALLYSRLQPEAMHFGHRLVGLDTKGSVTRLTFENGRVIEADVVIGADGIDSTVREILLGPEAPIYTGYVAYRGIFPAARLSDHRVSADITKWWPKERGLEADDRHILIYYLDRAREELYFVTGTPDPDWEPGPSSVPCEIDEIKERYDGFHPEVMRVIDACPQATKWPLLERKPFALWSRDNIVLLGDACHPMKPHMGQGAGMAMEDAAMMFRCIEHVGGDDFPAAFRLYEANRQERTAKVQQVSGSNTFLKQESDPSWVFGYDAFEVPLVAAN
jgi:6-hydroxynicotinate 3-monooxygenase